MAFSGACLAEPEQICRNSPRRSGFRTATGRMHRQADFQEGRDGKARARDPIFAEGGGADYERLAIPYAGPLFVEDNRDRRRFQPIAIQTGTVSVPFLLHSTGLMTEILAFSVS
ncbi:hypothetical protein [Mesorhizobium captivum]|uniref:hypothetical protein n=1 Tax=Mesorhizobium captivum TaxID=3072319 RepID=UPI002A2440A2|nr:hypothetical protein [Mesorhizobium sp. VK23E]MDX8512060.1 hypothetical protein [Mesorhizobium sp. VK23E]